MQRYRWSDELLTGEPLVDLQHKTLFEMVEALRVAVEAGLAQTIVVDSLSAMMLYASDHFRDEEALMKRVEYPGLASQRRMHEAFAGDAAEMALAYAERHSITAEVLYDFLSDWLDNHVRTQDALLARFLDAEYREQADR